MRSRVVARALAAWLCATPAMVAPALAGPDFATPDRSQPLAVQDARAMQLPAEELEFPYDSHGLLPAAQQQLAAVATWMNHHLDVRLVLEGHADSAGPAPYHEDLATRRVELARNHLVALGVDTDRIVLAVHGENRARRDPSRRDRRVVMFASSAPLGRLVAAELRADAIEVSWTRDGSVYRQSSGITPVAATVPPARNRVPGPRGG